MYKVLLPEYMQSDAFAGTLDGCPDNAVFLQGVVHLPTGYVNINGHSETSLTTATVAKLVPQERMLREREALLIVYRALPLRSDAVHLQVNGHLAPCRVEFYNLAETVFSRNEGLLETAALLNKKLVVSGCGSVGSLVAIEMARAGVGRFSLIDHDVLEYHNICRHQCGISEVGKFKVDAVADCIRNVNPNARIEVFRKIVEDLTKDEAEACLIDASVAVGCADNREGDLYLDQLSEIYSSAFVSIGLWEGAAAGEIYFFNPDKPEHKRYRAVFGNGDDIFSKRVSKNRRTYTFNNEPEAEAFQPGLSADIHFVTSIANKVIIDLLNRSKADFRPRVINDLKQFTLICNFICDDSRDDDLSIFSYPLQITRSIVV